MNKPELVEEVTNYIGLTKTESREVIGSIISVITDCLVRGEKATLVGFRTFQVGTRKARTGRNPLKQGRPYRYQPKGYPSSYQGKL